MGRAEGGALALEQPYGAVLVGRLALVSCPTGLHVDGLNTAPYYSTDYTVRQLQGWAALSNCSSAGPSAGGTELGTPRSSGQTRPRRRYPATDGSKTPYRYGANAPAPWLYRR